MVVQADDSDGPHGALATPHRRAEREEGHACAVQVHLGDWRYRQRATGEERARALAYISGAEEEELQELDESMISE